MLEQHGDIRLFATDAIQRLRQHDVELPALSILRERLDARPQNHAGAGNSRILVSADDRPLLALGLLPADAQLVFDRRIECSVRPRLRLPSRCYVVAPKDIIVSEIRDRIVVSIKTAASLNPCVINNFFAFIVRDDFSDRSEPRLARGTDESSPKLRSGPKVVLCSPSHAQSAELVGVHKMLASQIISNKKIWLTRR
jgi:hypothetical protein